ncbi:MAG: ABC transporter ATP-binding protein [Caldilineaceae bacterium]|nr:ABC transporter ATP-binding protein [Caldilineaceae bacterium]
MNSSPIDTLIDIQGLKTHFPLDEGTVKAVDGVDFTIRRNRTLCVVGESGCGKSITARSILQIVDKPGLIVEGSIRYHRRRDGGSEEVVDLAQLDPYGPEMRDIRGKEISMIFQEPMTSLSPVHTIGKQITETIRLHMPLSKQEAKARAIELLRRVGIPQPDKRIDDYPFQLSGGMRQRAMIAMALSCNPSLVIADEPTTAVDVTTQAQILELMAELQEEYGMAIMLITHDLGVVAETADDVVVMYLGTVAERGSVEQIFFEPKHPYTKALLRSIPAAGAQVSRGHHGQAHRHSWHGARSLLDPHRLSVPSPLPSNDQGRLRCEDAAVLGTGGRPQGPLRAV